MARRSKGRTKPLLQGLPEQAYRAIREQILRDNLVWVQRFRAAK